VSAPAASTRSLLALAASAFVVLAAEPLYLLVDTAVVGHLGPRPLGGLAVGAALMGLLTIVGTFVEYGTTSRAARWYGAGRTEAAVGEGVQASWLAVLIGLAVVAVGELFAGPLTGALAGSEATRHAAESWFRIAVLGLPGVLLVLAGNGWMRGVQRTREPVWIVLAANAASAMACPLLVYPAGLGLEGSAVANVVAQLIGAALFLRALRRAAGHLRPDRVVMRAQLVVGRDLMLRSAAFQVAFLTAAGVASRMGTAELGAHQIGLQLWEFTALLLDSFAIAAQSLVGAALGASTPTPPAPWPGRCRGGGCTPGSASAPRTPPPGPSCRGCSRPRPRSSTRRTSCGRGSWRCCPPPAWCSPSTACSSARGTSASCAPSPSSPPSARSPRSTWPRCTGTGVSAVCGPG